MQLMEKAKKSHPTVLLSIEESETGAILLKNRENLFNKC